MPSYIKNTEGVAENISDLGMNTRFYKINMTSELIN